MTRFLLLLTLGMLALPLKFAAQISAQTITPKGGDDTFEVATWNIEWFGSANGPSDDEQQRENVRLVIAEAGIDLWAVQEISDVADFDLLLSELGAPWEGVLASYSQQQKIGFVYNADVVRPRITSDVTRPDAPLREQPLDRLLDVAADGDCHRVVVTLAEPVEHHRC